MLVQRDTPQSVQGHVRTNQFADYMNHIRHRESDRSDDSGQERESEILLDADK